jgi:hypothetical protein
VVAAGAATEAAAVATAAAAVVAMVGAGAMVVSAEATSNFSKAVSRGGRLFVYWRFLRLNPISPRLRQRFHSKYFLQLNLIPKESHDYA